MKRIVMYLVLSATIFMLFFLSEKNSININSDSELTEIVGSVLSEKAESSYTSAEDINRFLQNIDCKKADKYRLLRILSYIENSPDITNVKKVKTQMSNYFLKREKICCDDIFDYSKVMYEQLFDKQSTIYRSKNALSCKNLKIPMKVLCSPLSDKDRGPYDGRYWMYSGNYFISFDGNDPEFIIRSVRGMREIAGFPDIDNIMSSKELLDAKSSLDKKTLFDDGEDRVVSFKNNRNNKGSVICVLKKGFSSPVLFNFSLFNKFN